MSKIFKIFRVKICFDIRISIFEFLLDIFFPKRCVCCGKHGGYLCFECAKTIEVIKTDTCPGCGRISKFGRFCVHCRHRSPLTGLMVAAHYDGPVKQMIHHFKYLGILGISELLGEVMYQRVRGRLPEEFVVVPVPLHRKREAVRGFNQSELLARYISKKLSAEGGLALTRTRYTESQAQLAKNKRLSNLAGAFAVSDIEFIRGNNVLLVDDVATTLSTLNECAKILRQSGAKQVWAIVAARG